MKPTSGRRGKPEELESHSHQSAARQADHRPFQRSGDDEIVAVADRYDEGTMTHRETSPTSAADHDLLQRAIDLGLQCPPSRTAFSVGAVIVGASGEVIATGYSRESEPEAHAEETALAKVGVQSLAEATLYSSLEPCSARSSRPTSCTDLILAAGIERVVFALHEPAVFVEGRGGERLRAAGVQVIHLPELAAQVEHVNAHLLHI